MRVKLGTAYGSYRDGWTVDIPDGATVVNVRPDRDGNLHVSYYLALPDPPAPPYDPRTSAAGGDASGYTGAFSIEDALPEDVATASGSRVDVAKV